MIFLARHHLAFNEAAVIIYHHQQVGLHLILPEPGANAPARPAVVKTALGAHHKKKIDFKLMGDIDAAVNWDGREY